MVGGMEYVRLDKRVLPTLDVSGQKIESRCKPTQPVGGLRSHHRAPYVKRYVGTNSVRRISGSRMALL